MTVGVAVRNPAIEVPAAAGRGAPGVAASAAPGLPGGALTASDLAEILSRFNVASEALQRTHETLQAEVSRLQEELREANEELERSRRLAALGQMAAGIAHEVRNPLASIALDARLLERESAGKADAARAACRIGESVRGLNHVVTDVLCFAKEMSPRLERVDVGDLFERVEQECGPLAVAAGVAIERADAGASGLWCDADLARRAIVNLVRNAIEAMGEAPDGMLDRKAVRLEHATESRGGRRAGVVRIVDSGPGIGQRVIERMFNPFFTTRAAGTGLGLAIVHRIMDAHAGRVEAWNNADRSTDGGVGATFELVFPEPGARGRSRRAPMEISR
ncbi:MAG: ATP-binding protein [Phycisphaerales bacterium]